jgi:predicted phosphohydrolase
MYSSIFPILISQITWVPISLSYPDSKIKEIIKQVNPNLIIYDHIFKKRVSFLNSIKKISFNEISKIQSTIDRSDLIEKKIKEL